MRTPQTNGLTQGSYSFELFRFHDFFHDLFKFFKTLGLAFTFKNFRTLLILGYFWSLHSSTDTNSGVHQNACRSRSSIASLYLTLSLPFHRQQLSYPVADPGEGPDLPLFLDQTEARRAEKTFFGRPCSPFSTGLDDPPLHHFSQGLNPALLSNKTLWLSRTDY